METCEYVDARRGLMEDDERCPACGCMGKHHVRECYYCAGDISAADAGATVDTHGHLCCDDCKAAGR